MNARTNANSQQPTQNPPADLVETPQSGTTRAATLERLSGSGTMLAAQGPLTMPFAPSDVINGKYQVIGLIGAGGVAYVIAALHLELGELVALKFLRPESLAHEEVVARFATEARAVARVRSEYVARVFDVGSLPDGTPFIVMEYLEGKDLSDVLAEHTKLSVKVAVEYVMQTCEALACAHASGIVHRDIKPENLFLTRQTANLEVIKVLDFGISKTALTAATPNARRFAKTMLPMGTPAYMSPEQIRASGEVDARTDIWAVGCVLFELLTGACAFDAPTLMQLGAAILESEPIPLRKLLPDAPQELESIILKCLEKDPDARFQNVAELAAALYVFGPRRSRVTAERCARMLQQGENPPAELSSIGPPPPASTQPAQTEPLALPTGTPATLTLAQDEYPQRKRRVLPALLVGLVAAALGVVGLRVLSAPSEVPTGAQAAAVLGAPPVATADPAPEIPASATQPSASGETAPSEPWDADAHADAKPPEKPVVRRLRPVPPAYQPAARVKREIVAPKAKASATGRAAFPVSGDEHEPDVGY